MPSTKKISQKRTFILILITLTVLVTIAGYVYTKRLNKKEQAQSTSSTSSQSIQSTITPDSSPTSTPIDKWEEYIYQNDYDLIGINTGRKYKGTLKISFNYPTDFKVTTSQDREDNKLQNKSIKISKNDASYLTISIQYPLDGSGVGGINIAKAGNKIVKLKNSKKAVRVSTGENQYNYYSLECSTCESTIPEEMQTGAYFPIDFREHDGVMSVSLNIPSTEIDIEKFDEIASSIILQ